MKIWKIFLKTLICLDLPFQEVSVTALATLVIESKTTGVKGVI